MDPESDRKKVRESNYVTWRRQGGWDPLLIAGAEGSTFWDSQGRRFLDFSSQLIAANLGYGNSAVLSAIGQ